MARSHDQKGYGTVAAILSLFFSIIIGLVAIRFLFRLIGANASNGFVSWIYSASQPLVSPFFGIFGHDVNVSTGRFEFDTLIALFVYALIASLVTGFFSRMYRRPRSV